MSESDAVLVYVTVGDSDAALSIARALVDERLAASANIIGGVHSIYRWQGAVEAADEAVLVLKTRRAHLEALTARVRALHAYDCPCVVALPIVGGNPAYLDWIAAETSDD
jgi:periplasmic divalent cation tolerance protein